MRNLTLLLAGFAGLAGLVARADASDSDRTVHVPEVAPDVNGGTPVAAGDWQDTAGLYRGNYIQCTGTLIAPTLVLTARHCLGAQPDHVIVNSVNYGVGESIGILRSYPHPDLDVAVLELVQASTIEPRMIAAGCILTEYAENGADVAIVGWGAIDADASEYPDVLMEAVTTIRDVSCTGPQADQHGCEYPNGEMIAGGDTIDSCNGDSGGPLYLLTPRGDFLIGVTSRALDDSTEWCGEGGIYTRADAPMQWIEQVTGVTLPQPSCNEPPVPEVLVMEIEVEAGETVEVEIGATDPDGSGALSYSVGASPMYGAAVVAADGVLSFTADADFEGADSMTVVIEDSGAPPATASVIVNITIVPPEGCEGCASSSGGATSTAWLAAAVAALLWPRRRRARG